MTTPAVILAAGASSRLGQPKQLLEHRGRTLIEHAIDLAHQADAAPVFVVLGSHADEIAPLVEHAGARAVVNRAWQGGQSTTVAAGVAAARTIEPDPSGVLLMLCDQPHVEPGHLQRLMKLVSGGEVEIAATRHPDPVHGVTAGAPACFGSAWFDRLINLSGDAGARSIIDPGALHVRLVDHPPAGLDIDRPDDLARLDP